MRFGLAVVALALVCLAPDPAAAYIVVLKNGTLVDVGDSYRITGSNLEFRAPGGGTRSIPLYRIDFAGTEMMNGESIDEFMSRASKALIRGGSPSAPPPPSTTRPRRAAAEEPPDTVTNATLEPYRIERERADAEYRKRNPAPPPSADPLRSSPWRRPRPADPAPLPEHDEWASWRAEARLLREQLETEEAQIVAIQEEVAYRQENPMRYRLSHEYNYGNSPVYAGPYGYYDPYGTPYGPTRADAELHQLSARLVDLQIQHEGTLARWELFLERARRAGVPPGVVYDHE